MADRFFDEATRTRARRMFAERYATQARPGLPTMLRTSEAIIFNSILHVPERRLEWRESARTTEAAALLEYVGSVLWNDLTADERLILLWKTPEYAIEEARGAVTYSPTSIPWGMPDESPVLGWEHSETQREFLRVLATLPDATRADISIKDRLHRDHSARAIFARLDRDSIELSPQRIEQLWHALWARDVCDRALHVAYDERARFPESTQNYWTQWIDENARKAQRAVQGSGSYETAYRRAMENTADALSEAIVVLAVQVNARPNMISGVDTPLPIRRLVQGQRLVPEVLLDAAELWVMLGRYPVLCFRTAAMAVHRNDPSSALFRVLRLVRYATAPRVWPRGDQREYQNAVAIISEQLHALQLDTGAGDVVAWAVLRERLYDLLLGLLYADPGVAIYERVGTEPCARSFGPAIYADVPNFGLQSIPRDVYDANVIDERRARAVRGVTELGAAPLAVFDYDTYDHEQKQRERMALADRERRKRQAVEEHDKSMANAVRRGLIHREEQTAHQLPVVTPSPSSDEDPRDYAETYAHAQRARERADRGTGAGGGFDDDSLFVMREEEGDDDEEEEEEQEGGYDEEEQQDEQEGSPEF